MRDELTSAQGQVGDRGRVEDAHAEISIGVLESLAELMLTLLNATVEITAHLHLGLVQILSCQNAALECASQHSLLFDVKRVSARFQLLNRPIFVVVVVENDILIKLDIFKVVYF